MPLLDLEAELASEEEALLAEELSELRPEDAAALAELMIDEDLEAADPLMAAAAVLEELAALVDLAEAEAAELLLVV